MALCKIISIKLLYIYYVYYFNSRRRLLGGGVASVDLHFSLLLRYGGIYQ